jgi:hypothetical protein
MDQGPFLTSIDPRAAIKGSRDPLGIQSIWTRMGRRVVGNLTTITTSTRDFTTTLLGYWLAEKINGEKGGEGDLDAFLKWEQLAAYSRYVVNKEEGIRGIERVKKAQPEHEAVLLCADGSAQILSNQRTYGLWGLYTGPARASGLVAGDPTRLTSTGRAIVEECCLPAMAKNGLGDGRLLVDIIKGHSYKLNWNGKDKNLMRGVGKTLGRAFSEDERRRYRRALVMADDLDHTDGLQRELAAAIDTLSTKQGWAMSPSMVEQLAGVCEARHGRGSIAARRLREIAVTERLLVPVAMMFGALLAYDGKTVQVVAERIKRAWPNLRGCIDLKALIELKRDFQISPEDVESGERWIYFAMRLAGGDYAAALEEMIQQNAAVMRLRGSDAWVGLREGRLEIRFQDNQAVVALGERDPGETWLHPFFIDALAAITRELRNVDG